MSFFKSVVENYNPTNPLKFKQSDGSVAEMAQIIKKSAPQLTDGYSYWVNPLLSSGHTQTAYTAINKFENVDKIHYKRELITVEPDKFYMVENEKFKYDQWDGKSTFAVDYVNVSGELSEDPLKFKPESQSSELPPRTEYKDPKENIFPDDSKPLLIALHGLSGGSFESYVRSLLTEVTSPETNIDALVINSRGCAHHTITSPQLFCGLWTNDLRYFVNEHVKKRWPNKKVFLIGFSLGGAIAANYVGQEKDDIYKQIKGAFIMGSPWDFSDGSYLLQESLLGNRLYSPVMCQNLLKLLKKHYKGQLMIHEFIDKYDKDPSKFNLNTLRDFDDNFTCKLFGFNSSFEYYRHASPVQRLFKFRVPTIIISAKDDPVCGLRSLPIDESRLNPYVTLITTTIGGHLGWFDFKHNRWYPKPVAGLMKELANYDLEKDDIKLPLDADKVWKHDRLYYQ